MSAGIDGSAFPAPERIVLASSSPRRAELLRMLGLSFRVVPQDLLEIGRSGESPLETARRLADEKARAAVQTAELDPTEVVLGADTIVTLDGLIYGKPATPSEAQAVLEALSGREHEVVSAVALRTPESRQAIVEHDCSGVRFRALSPEEIAWYLATGECRDAAGGYKVQGRGAWFVEAIHGSFYTVMGLPIHRLYSILKRVSFRF